MINITFKNVGQGDSIIIQWTKLDGSKGIGVIDCNLDDNYKNPVVDHLKIIECDYLDFFILTHPHSDHYSGLMELLDFLENRKLTCGKIINSCAALSDFLTTPSKKMKEDLFNELNSIYHKFFELNRKGIVSSYASLGCTDNIEVPLDNLKIIFFSPSMIEAHNFNKAEHNEQKAIGLRNPNYNYLCTLMKIKHEGKCIVLTSDAKASTFKRIVKRDSTFFNDKIDLVQVAHHGGNSSYYKSFWEKIEKNIPVVVSVGKNNYGHPNENVINSIRNLGFNIHSTNKVGCLKGKKSLRAENTNSFFDLFEDFIEIVDDANLQGDQSFRF